MAALILERELDMRTTPRGSSRLDVLAECGWHADGPLLIFRSPPRASLTGARLHIGGKVLGRTRKHISTVVAIVAWITTTANQAGPNPRQDKDHQKNYPGRDERRTHVGSQEMGQPSTTGARSRNLRKRNWEPPWLPAREPGRCRMRPGAKETAPAHPGRSRFQRDRPARYRAPT